MSIAKKVWLTLRAKANKASDRMADPGRTLDYSYQRQLELLTKIQRGVADVAASRARVGVQMRALGREQAELEDLARREPGADGERGARKALRRKAELDSELSSLAAHYDSMRTEEEELTVACERLQMKVETFRVRKEVIKATYAAAEAQCRVGEVWSSISEQMDSAGMAAISYPRQREMLTQLWCSIKGMTASREELDRQMNTLRERQAELEDQDRQALDTGQVDLAQLAPAQKAEIDSQLSDLAAQHHSLQADEEKLTTAYDQLAAKVEALRVQKETAQGTYTSGEGSTTVDELASTLAEKTDAGDMPETSGPH
jgi:phage shock protein A